MKKMSILTLLFAISSFVAFAHAQDIYGSGEVRVICSKEEGIGEECCKMTGNQGSCQCGMGGCESRFFMCCAKEIGLNEDQIERLKALQLEHRKARIRMRADIEIGELELKHLLHESEPNRSAIDSKIKAIGDLKTKTRKNTVDAHLDARSVLTKEQMEKCKQGSCGCCSMEVKKVIEHESCSPQEACPNKGRQCDTHCK